MLTLLILTLLAVLVLTLKNAICVDVVGLLLITGVRICVKAVI